MKRILCMGIASVAVWLGLARVGEGCAVPVFRYALEQWAPYPYEAIVFHRDPLPAATTNALNALEKSSVNLAVWLTNLNDEMPDELKKLWAREKDKAAAHLPWVVVRYPYAFWEAIKRDVLWSGPFDAAVLGRMVDSPLRTKIAEEMLKGVSAVWIFIESGNREVDDAKAKILKDRLDLIVKEVQLPEESHQEVSQGDLAGVVPLKIDFRVLRVSRADVREKFFTDMLLMTEPDFRKHEDKPMAFPVFGQGRAIWGLVGDGINEEMIDSACGFMLGFCSCQIKDMNPGVDMLINANWYAAVTNLMSVPGESPALVGATAEGVVERAASDEARPDGAAAGPAEPGSARRRVMIGVAAAFVVLVSLVALVTALLAGRVRE